MDTTDIDFEVEIKSTGKLIEVKKDESILAALRAAGMEVESSCEAGTCGTCMTRYLDGEPEHQDFVLGTDEQAEYIMLCVSRCKTPRLVLDL
ncbi:MAG: ferredoxin [Paucimonas sp.]|nr:ferredoxin [Paucimonas sp.]